MQKRCLLFLSNNCRSWILLVVQSSATKLPQLCGSTYDFWCRQIGRLTTYLLRINCIGMNINLHVAGSTSHLIFKFLFGLRTIHSSHKSGKKKWPTSETPPQKKIRRIFHPKMGWVPGSCGFSVPASDLPSLRLRRCTERKPGNCVSFSKPGIRTPLGAGRSRAWHETWGQVL